MNRQYEIEEVKRCVLDLQKNIPGLNIETNIIVGFPGESEIDFQASLDLLKTISFSKVVIYRYQDRPGTKSINLPDKVSKRIVQQRIRIIRKQIKNSVY
jgi:tRNA A37 methylthiotransferase MiaB